MSGPYPTDTYSGSFNFRVTVSGINDPFDGFTKCSGIVWETESWTHNHGMMAGDTDRELPGRNTFNELVLERVYAGFDDFMSWRQRIVSGQQDRRNVSVEVMRQDMSVVKRWELLGAWPSSYESPDLSAMGSDGAMERFELTYETLIEL